MIRFKSMYAPTRKIAIPMASLKPLRNTPPRIATSTSVMVTSRSRSNSGTSGLPATCSVADEAESVMVKSHAVATNPSRNNTNSLPRQNDSKLSSMAIDPCPCGLAAATRR
jgi:hypothetical protein